MIKGLIDKTELFIVKQVNELNISKEITNMFKHIRQIDQQIDAYIVQFNNKYNK